MAKKEITLRKPQAAILVSLMRSRRKYHTRAQVAELSQVDPTKIGDYAGPRPENQTPKARERYNFDNLVELRFLKVETHDIDGRDKMVYTITPKGRDRAKQEAKSRGI